MSMACSICNHPKRLEIDRALVAGKSYQMLANEYGVDWQALRRHKQDHLSRQLSKAYQMQEAAESMDLLTRIEDILSKAQKIFDRNYEKGKDGLALKALSEQRSTIELLAKIAAFLHESRAAELQASQSQNEDESTKENQRRLSVLTFDEILILQALHKKMDSGDRERRVRIPYTYVSRKSRDQEEDVYTYPEEETAPDQEQETVPDEETISEEVTVSEEVTKPKMTRKAVNPLAIEPDLSSPQTKLPRNPRHWIRYGE